MLSKIKSPRPLQFGEGSSNLWRGFKKVLVEDKNYQHPGLFFNSARSAIAFTLKNLPRIYGDDVIVTSFTCDAVTDAVIASKKKLLLIDINLDLTLPAEKVLKLVSSGARILIVQNTMGKMGLQPEFIEKLMLDDVFIIVDNSLSYGTTYNGKDIGKFGHVEIESFEVSKTITCGWGGRLKFQKIEAGLKNTFFKKYRKIPNHPFIKSFLERVQLEISAKYINKFYRHGFLVWYFLYGFRIFRKSKIPRKKFEKNIRKINKFNFIYLNKILSQSNEIFEIAFLNYLEMERFCKKIGLNYVKCTDQNITRSVSPRFSILLRRPFDSTVKSLFEKHKVDLGRWFDIFPASIETGANFKNTKFLNEHIINIPLHFTLNDDDKNRFKKLMLTLRECGY